MVLKLRGPISIMVAAYEYFPQTKILNANNYFNNVRGQRRPQDRYNLFGAKLGGPIPDSQALNNGKEKDLFSSSTTKGLRQSSPFANLSSVPSNCVPQRRLFGFVRTHCCKPGTTTPFPGNRIPSNLIDFRPQPRYSACFPRPNSLPGPPDLANGRST